MSFFMAEKDTIGTRPFDYRHDFLRNWREVKEKGMVSLVTPSPPKYDTLSNKP